MALSPRFAFNDRLKLVSANEAVLEYGSTGEAVRIIQQSLIELGYWMDKSLQKFNTPDGIYGSETRDRIRAFQSAHDLYQDGRLGHKTLEKNSANCCRQWGRFSPRFPKRRTSRIG